MPVNFAERLKEAEKAGIVGGGDYLKIKAGQNRFRLVSECLPHEGEYQGKKNFKWLCLVLDRSDSKVKPFFMPHTIYKQIVGLQQSDDYAFEDVPMPYDLTITPDEHVGTKNVKYTLTPARANKPLTSDELIAVRAHKTVQEVKAALDEKTAKNGGQRDDDVPPHSDDDSGEPF